MGIRIQTGDHKISGDVSVLEIVAGDGDDTEQVEAAGKVKVSLPAGGGGGSQPWVELFNSEDLTDSSPAWTGRTEDGGDWEIGAAGVISQTDDTGDDDTDKKLTLDLSEFFTADALAGVTGLAIACEYRADSAPGDNFGQITCQGANVTLGIITQATDWVVYEQTDDDPFVVPVGDWSAQSLALTAVATAVLAGGVVCDDGGGTGGVPRVVGLNYSPGIECMAYVGGFQFGGADIAFKTTNGAGSFRRLRIFAIYGQPAIPAP